MKQLSLFMTLGALMLGLAACETPINADMTGTPEIYIPPQRPSFDPVKQNERPPVPGEKKKHLQKVDLAGQKAVPMDILFVVDTSQSMCSDQDSLARNINRFVEMFLKNDKIDFHIGVTVTWDSRLYGNAVRKYKNGELRPVFGQGSNVRFVTNKTKDLHNTLAKTLYVGFEPYDKTKPETTGPLREELFSPILAALSDDMAAGVNQGFRRPDAHLAVVMVTDTDDMAAAADDASDALGLIDTAVKMKASAVAEELKTKVRGEATVTVLAALARFDEMIQFQRGENPGLTTFNQKFPNGRINSCNEYTVDPALVEPLKGPEQVTELVRLMKGSAFDLRTRDFGGKMAGLGRTLLNKAMSFKIVLEKAPDVSEPMTVSINGKPLPRNDVTGWSYQPDINTIVLNEGLNLGELEQFQVEVGFTILN